MSATGICAVCQKTARLRCSACHSVFYCGKEHQTNDWQTHKTLCKKHEIKACPDLVKCIVASKKLIKGEVIVDEKPIVVGPDYLNDQETLCIGCNRNLRLKFRCPQCGWPVCSPKCPGLLQPTRHSKAECAVLTKIKSAVIQHSRTVILPLRCLLLQKHDPKKWKIILKMADSAANLSSSRDCNESMYLLKETILKPLAKTAPEMLPDCSVETVKKIYDVLNVYGLDVHAPQFGHLIVICGVTSLMEHSCVPNTRRFVDMPPVDEHCAGVEQLRCRVVVRATKEISKGERLSTLFMDTWMCTWTRQLSLASRRLIHCRCARCLDPRELGTDFGTLKCTNTPCTGWVLPVNTLRIDFSDWKCATCAKNYPSSYVMDLLLRLKNEMEGCRVGENQEVDTYEAMLARLLNYLHPNHHYCMLLKERLFSYHGRLLGVGIGGTLTNDQLKRTAELSEEVLKMMMHPAIVTQNREQVAQCMMMYSFANAEMAKRMLASGEWAPDRANKVIIKSRELARLAVRERQSQFDISAAEERMPIELIDKMSLLMWSRVTGV